MLAVVSNCQPPWRSEAYRIQSSAINPVCQALARLCRKIPKNSVGAMRAALLIAHDFFAASLGGASVRREAADIPAKTLGFTVPATLLARADEVIE